MPIHFLELASASPDGTTHARMQTWLTSCHCEGSAILPLHTDRHSQMHTLGPLGWQRGNGMQQLGGPFAPLQKLLTPQSPPLTLS